MARFKINTLGYFLDAFLLSYSRILFSDSRILGLFIIVSTLIIPSHGVCGILGALFANFWAYILGVDRQSIQKGIFGFNGVLTGLGLGFFYGINPQLIFTLFVISSILTFITILLNNTFYSYLGMPAMTLPFCIITILVILASISFGYLHTSPQKWSILNISIPYLPTGLNVFFSSIGNILFQSNILPGIIIAIGLLIYSRISLVLILTGFLAGVWMHNFLGIDKSLIEAKYLGFNYMLAALACGGVFTVPSLGSFTLSFIASITSVILLVGIYNLFPKFLYPLALPFNLAVLLILYGLRSRYYPSMGVWLVEGEPTTPEENLNKFRQNLRQWKRWGRTISLPFYGRWKVSQGADSEPTHRGNWRFAYDFQAVDFYGNTYKSNGSVPEDYYGYGVPIIAPVSGKIYAVKDDIYDNPIGKVNTEDRWGNYIIIESAPNFYACICHLKQGSIKVKVEEEVKKGQVIAQCGNSGRSPYPHIHLQFQMIPKIGAPSLYFEFSNILLLDEGKPIFLPKGILKEKSIVQNITYPVDFDRFFSYTLDKVWCYKFKVKDKGLKIREEIELWKMDVDFYGNTFIVSSPKTTRLYFYLSEGLLSIRKLEGNPDTGLFLFGNLISEVPFIQRNDELNWTSFEPADYVLKPIYTRLLDIFSLFGISINQKVNTKIKPNQDQIILNINRCLCLKIPFHTISLRELPPLNIVFKRNVGLERVEMANKELEILSNQ